MRRKNGKQPLISGLQKTEETSAYRVTRLENGVRIASIEMPHMRSAAVGIWAGVGGRHENAEQSGVSHFLEHMLFKGTARRNARRISADVEGIGGYINAFTTEDHTCFYAKAESRHLERLADVLGDIYVHSQFPAGEIEREREVIREEIYMYRDQPAQHVQEVMTEVLWPDHPLGRALTGTEETVNALSRESFLEFHRHYYSGSNTVATVAGRVTHEQAVAALAPVLSLLPHGAPPEFDASPVPPGRACMKVIEQDTEQVHLSLGFHAWGRLDERRFALKLLSVILGENMSSRLFQKLRERHGFCYSISSGIVTLADTGAIHISAGLDPAKVDRALKVTMQELELLASKPVTLKELRMAQDYTAGQALMGLESTSSQIMWMGECLLGYERVLCPNEVERRFTEVTPEQIQSVAAQALNEGGLGVAIIGPDEKRLTKAFAPLLR